MKAGATFTISVVSHAQGQLCAALLADLALHCGESIARVVLTANVPETLPSLEGLPFPVTVVRNASPLGFGENHNRAFHDCATAHFAVLNPDLRIAADPFPALALRLLNACVGIAAPVVRESDGSVADFARPLVTPWQVLRRRWSTTVDARQLENPDWIAGMFMAFAAENFRALGGFDTRYFLYCEDVDICARARLRGLRLVVSQDVSVQHLAQRASRRAPGRMRLHASSLLRFWNSPVYHQYRDLLRTSVGTLDRRCLGDSQR